MKHLILNMAILLITACSLYSQNNLMNAERLELFGRELAKHQHSRGSSNIYKLNEQGEYVINFDIIKGSPYENNNFLMGLLVDEVGHKNVNIYLRYNIYNDVIEFKEELYSPNTLALLKQKDISCVINGMAYKYLTFTNESNTELDGYLKVLYAGKNYSAYQHLSSHFTPKQAAENSFIPGVVPTFDTKSQYFIQQGDSISPLPYKRKEIYKKFPDQADALKPFFSKNKKNLRSAEGAKALTQFLDSKS